MLAASFLENIESFMLPCLSKKIFGIDCFGCGMQRSLLLLFKGEFKAAFKMYPAIYTLIILFAAIALNLTKYTNIPYKFIKIITIINALIIVIGYFTKKIITI